MCMFGCVHMVADAHRRQRIGGSLELELEVMSHPTWVLGTESKRVLS